MTWIKNRLIERKWFRRLMIKLSYHIFEEQILELLYPDDLEITFGEDPLDS